MDVKIFDLPTAALAGAPEGPSITALYPQSDGSLLCGRCFATPALLRIKPNASATKVDIEDMKLESEVGEAFYGITHGLRGTETGDTAFALWMPGMLPAFLRGLSGGNLTGKSGKALLAHMSSQSGGLGTGSRHAVLQLVDKQLKGRRMKEAGILLDAAHIGDFVYGLDGSSIWREPYLNMEKRETLRSDLEGNFRLHRDANGVMWLQGSNGRLLRLSYMDIKAKPTPLKLPGDKPNWRLSAASDKDDWLYGVADAAAGAQLFRLRINPVTAEEEFQSVAELEHPVGAMAIVEGAEKSQLVLALESPQGVELRVADLLKHSDAEEKGPLPQLHSEGYLSAIQSVGALTVDAANRLWLGEGRLGSSPKGASRLLVAHLR